MKKSAKGKVARASDRDDSLHTEGSARIRTHRRRMEKEKGRSVTMKVLEASNVKKKKDGKDTRVDPRVERTYGLDERCQSQPSEDGSLTQPLDDEMKIWLNVVGVIKKGRAYDLGSHHHLGRPMSALVGASNFPQSNQNQREMEAMWRKIEGMTKMYETERAVRVSQGIKLEQLQDKVDRLFSSCRFGANRSPLSF